MALPLFDEDQSDFRVPILGRRRERGLIQPLGKGVIRARLQAPAEVLSVIGGRCAIGTGKGSALFEDLGGRRSVGL